MAQSKRIPFDWAHLAESLAPGYIVLEAPTLRTTKGTPILKAGARESHDQKGRKADHPEGILGIMAMRAMRRPSEIKRKRKERLKDGSSMKGLFGGGED